MPKFPLTYRELIKRLSQYGIVVMAKKRGKGSERILLKPSKPGSNKGPQYPIKHYGHKTEIQVQVINAILIRFNIDKDKFWE